MSERKKPVEDVPPLPPQPSSTPQERIAAMQQRLLLQRARAVAERRELPRKRAFWEGG